MRSLRLSLYAGFVLVLLLAGARFSLALDPVGAPSREIATRAWEAGWIAGETAISRLPHFERRLRTALIKPELTGVERMARLNLSEVYAQPATFDWRNNGGNFVTAVKDQGSCGSCWAFSTAGALESLKLITRNTPNVELNFSEQILVSCSGAGTCNGGYIDKASDFIHDTGLPPDSCYPYSATDSSCSAACANWQSSTEKSDGWTWIATTSPSVDAIKKALYTYGPLVTTMNVYSDFFYYSSGVYRYTSGTYQGAHAILIVGYDDPGQYFIVKNSWGTDWGEQGYFRINYSQLKSKVRFGSYTLADVRAGDQCTCSVSPSSASFPKEGGQGTASISASATSCPWTATSDTWITLTSAASGTGNGSIAYSVSPNSGGPRAGAITMTGATLTINQAGVEIPDISVSPASLAFSTTRVGRSAGKKVTVSNTGKGNLSITSIGIGGTNSTDFTQTNNCTTLRTKGSCTVTVTFKPEATGSKTASLVIGSNDPDENPVKVAITGRGY